MFSLNSNTALFFKQFLVSFSLCLAAASQQPWGEKNLKIWRGRFYKLDHYLAQTLYQIFTELVKEVEDLLFLTFLLCKGFEKDILFFFI